MSFFEKKLIFVQKRFAFQAVFVYNIVKTGILFTVGNLNNGKQFAAGQ